MQISSLIFLQRLSHDRDHKILALVNYRGRLFASGLCVRVFFCKKNVSTTQCLLRCIFCAYFSLHYQTIGCEPDKPNYNNMRIIILFEYISTWKVEHRTNLTATPRSIFKIIRIKNKDFPSRPWPVRSLHYSSTLLGWILRPHITVLSGIDLVHYSTLKSSRIHYLQLLFSLLTPSFVTITTSLWHNFERKLCTMTEESDLWLFSWLVQGNSLF